MSTIIGIAGSLRTGSFNAALLRACADLAPAGLSVEIESIGSIPLYNGDVENEQGIPDSVTRLKNRIAGSDGLLIVTPEYNNSMPGVLKNAIDWLTRPPGDIPRVFGDKPVALTGATRGRGGTRLAQTAWLPVFRTLGMRAWFGKQLHVAGAAQVFDGQGKIVDDTVKKLSSQFMEGFAAFVASHTPPSTRISEFEQSPAQGPHR